jgi:hypothetical protein
MMSLDDLCFILSFGPSKKHMVPIAVVISSMARAIGYSNCRAGTGRTQSAQCAQGWGAREARNVGRAGATEEVAWSIEREQKAAQRRYTGRLWPVISL